MKKILLPLLAAILIAAQVITPAAAEPCGTTYIVQPKDNLSKIANLCGLSLDDLLLRNPEITNPNIIRTGQVIRIAGNFSAPVTNPTGTSTSYGSGNARVSLSTTRAREGDDVTVYVSGFPPNSWIDYRVGQDGRDYTEVYDGTVNKRGTASITITLPPEADRGEYWVILVTTTSQRVGVEVTSARIYIE